MRILLSILLLWGCFNSIAGDIKWSMSTAIGPDYFDFGRKRVSDGVWEVTERGYGNVGAGTVYTYGPKEPALYLGYAVFGGEGHPTPGLRLKSVSSGGAGDSVVAVGDTGPATVQYQAKNVARRAGVVWDVFAPLVILCVGFFVVLRLVKGWRAGKVRA